MKKISILFLLAFFVVLSGCYKDNEENKIAETEKITNRISEEGSEESTSREELMVSEKVWDFSGEKYDAYNLNWEELTVLRKEQEIKDSIGETGLPQNVVGLFKDILLKQRLDNRNFPGKMLEPYTEKEFLVESEEILEMLGDSAPEGIGMGCAVDSAYIIDLDGDGKKELIMFLYYGNGGPVEVEIWKQGNDGTDWVCSEGYRSSCAYTGLISFEEHYYAVIELCFLHESRGYFLLSFSKDGETSLHEVLLDSQGAQKTWYPIYHSENADARVLSRLESYVENKKDEIEDSTVTKEELKGNGEVSYRDAGVVFPLEKFDLSGHGQEEHCIVADLDNDGKEECCYKRLFITELGILLTTYVIDGSGNQLEKFSPVFPRFTFEKDRGDYWENYCSPYQFWLEEFDGKTYMFCMDLLDNTSDYVLTAGIVQDGKFSPLLQYLLLDRKEFWYQNPDPKDYAPLL